MFSICFHMGLLLSLLQCGHQSCFTGTASQCKEADFLPGINLAGEGFDITTMAQKGAFVIDMKQWKPKDKTIPCTLCNNPFLEDKKQKLPLSVSDWRPSHKCQMKLSSSTYRSSEALVNSSSDSVENNWKVNLDLQLIDKSAHLMLAGTNSKLAEYSMAKTKSDKFSFTSHSISCEYYSYRLASRPKLSRDFKIALKDLPKCYSPENKQRFYSMIDTFGTHYITKVKLGGSVKSVTSVRQCQASLQGLNMDEVQMCLEMEASASMARGSLESEAKHCKKDIQKSDSKSSFSSLFDDRLTEISGGKSTEPDILFSNDPSAYKEWLGSLPQIPGIISYSLNPLHELLPTNNPKYKSLRSAINHYILEKALWRNCSESCQVGTKRSQSEPCACSCQGNAAVTPDCCPARKGMARVVITVQSASGLWGDQTTSTDGFVKVTFGGNEKRSTPVIWNNNNPHWGATFDLGDQNLSGKPRVRFEVWDEDNKWDDDLLGECERELRRGVKKDVCNLQHGRLYFKWEVSCAPSLDGEFCTDYKPSPISQHLQKVYVSRYAHRVPEAFLRENGVFVGVSGRHDNQSAASDFSQYREMH